MPGIISADEYDDISSLRTKIEQVAEERVAVVIPPENGYLDSPIALRLLHRHALARGQELSIVSRQAGVRRVAAEVGIAAFSSLRAYESRVERADGPITRLDAVAMELPQQVASFGSLLFVLAVMGAGLALAFMLVPVATVRVTPLVQPVSGAVQVVADVDARAPDARALKIPARTVLVLVEGTDQLDVRAKQTGGEARARGLVTFTNRTSDPVHVPAGTIVRTGEGVGFQTTEDLDVAPQAGAIGRVPIIAQEPGPRGNIPRLRIYRIDGPIQYSLTVLNEERTVGGGSATRPVVSAADRELLQRQILGKTRREAEGRLAALARDGEVVIPESVSFVPLEADFDRAVGEEAPQLGAHLKARASGMIVNLEDLRFVARETFKPTLAEGFALSDSDVTFSPPRFVAFDPATNRTMTLEVRIEGQARARLNLERVRQYVRWQTAGEAELSLAKEFPLAESPTVKIVPAWPGRAYRVEVVVDRAERTAEKRRPSEESSR
ncbi:MAG: baseplate J/gp47 family protein [Chloroflexi bacterium]|nr:baseplate J/gp47 family protein [Chloroflexota bacterium]